MQFLNTLDLETIILGIFTLLMIVLFMKWHMDEKNDIDMRSAFMKDGKLSLNKLGQAAALLVSTWIIIYQTRNNRLTDWLFTGYMVAWSGANLASKYIDSRNTSQYGSSYGTSSNGSPYGSVYGSSTGNTSVQQINVNVEEPPVHPNEVAASNQPKAPLDFRGLRKH